MAQKTSIARFARKHIRTASIAPPCKSRQPVGRLLSGYQFCRLFGAIFCRNSTNNFQEEAVFENSTRHKPIEGI